MRAKKLFKRFRAEPGVKLDLKDHPTDWTGTKAVSEEKRKARANETLEKTREELSDVQELLYASDSHAVLLIFQAMDAGGKDGTIRHVMSGVNPQGCQVFSFKKPSAEELDHTFLWRYAKCLPERGRIGIFNRSYYEDVLVVRVHPELLGATAGKANRKLWEQRYEDINAFERHLCRNGTLVLKFFLNVSKKEQKERFMERLTDPKKHWKFSGNDVVERGFWKDYMRAFEHAISATSTKDAPWYVIPADHKYVARALVADIIVNSIKALELKVPKVSGEAMKALEAARGQLAAE